MRVSYFSVNDPTRSATFSFEKFSKNKKQTTLAKETLTVEKVFENLNLIAKQEGKGSQEKKIDLVAELLSKSELLTARYITRTLLNQLRVGVAEGIIRDAIADAFGIEREIVENAWFLNQDYGKVAKIAKERGESGLRKVKIKKRNHRR